jgi:hypothetical protein
MGDQYDIETLLSKYNLIHLGVDKQFSISESDTNGDIEINYGVTSHVIKISREAKEWGSCPLSCIGILLCLVPTLISFAR